MVMAYAMIWSSCLLHETIFGIGEIADIRHTVGKRSILKALK